MSSWLENTHIISLVNSLPCILCFQWFNLSNSFLILIIKCAMLSFPSTHTIFLVHSSHCLQGEWMNTTKTIFFVFPQSPVSFSEKVIKFSPRAFHKLLHWGNIKCHHTHCHVSQFLSFSSFSSLLHLLPRQMWCIWRHMLWTKWASILFPFKVSEIIHFVRWKVGVVQPSEPAIILSRLLFLFPGALLVLKFCQAAFAKISLWSNDCQWWITIRVNYIWTNGKNRIMIAIAIICSFWMMMNSSL